ACLPFALAVYLARAPGSAVRRLLVVWFFIGVFEALPALVAYCKTMGDWNNFIIIDLWVAVVVWPMFLHYARSDRLIERCLGIFTPFLFMVALFPVKVPPMPSHYDYGLTLEQWLAADARQGRRVLLSHGTAPLLRAGITGVPRDRANSYLELLVAAQTDLAGT